MSVTISTHNGSTVCIEHNIRDQTLIAKENAAWERKYPGEVRIRPDGEYEVFKYEPLKKAYEKLFSEAVKEWNLRQTKKDRKIKDYLQELKAKQETSKNSKKPVYEIIAAVGSKNTPIPYEDAKSILKDYAQTFEERNPNLYVVCSAFHGDENGVPHVHISYVPVAYSCKRGMKVQNSLSEALKQQGITSNAYHETAQMLWQQSENQYLEKLTQSLGYEVIHPQAGSEVKHLTVEEYYLTKRIDDKQKHLEHIDSLPLGNVIVKKARLNQLEEIERKVKDQDKILKKAEQETQAAMETIQAAEKLIAQLKKLLLKLLEYERNLMRRINEAANKKIKIMQDKALRFIEVRGLKDEFKDYIKKSQDIQMDRRLKL